MFDALLGHPLTLRLGWTLLHSLWQGMALSALLGLGLLFLGPDRNRLRHALASLTLLLWLAIPIATLVVHAPSPAGGAQQSTPAVALAGETPALMEVETRPTHQEPSVGLVKAIETLGKSTNLTLSELQSLLPYAALAWLALATLLSLRLLGGILMVQRLARLGTPLPDLQARLDALASRLGLSRRVSLLASTRVDVPTALGWLWPVVLLPTSALTGLTRQQLELILAHELAHIRRHDYLVSICQGIAEALLFYHPLTWWLSHTLRSEREQACDDLALEATGSRPLELAETLVRLEAGRPAPVPALTATDSLKQRVRRLLQRRQHSPAYSAALLPIFGIALLGLWLALAAQPETASPGNWSVVLDPGHSDLFPGADGDVAEADLTLAIALRARELLERQEVKVQLTRKGSKGLADTLREDLEARAAMATPQQHAFISLHANFGTVSTAKGIETFIATPTADTASERNRYQASRRLAESIQEQLIETTGARDRRVKENEFAELRWAQSPAVLVNLGFLSSPSEGARLANDEYQELLARGLADGILAYLNRTTSPTVEQERGSGEYEIVIIDQPVSDLLPQTSLVIPFPEREVAARDQWVRP